MSIRNNDYRPNPQRAIYIQGPIDDSMVSRLTPKIIFLQSVSRKPITVYIDSPGGSTNSLALIRQLLSTSNQDLDPPCRIITVATNLAASAAADLLSFGDYALALPHARIFYHGVRDLSGLPITVEYGSAITESLKLSNDQSAIALARKTEWRFMFRFVTMKTANFDEVRKATSKPGMSDLDCFIWLISQNLSKSAQKLVSRARARDQRYGLLLSQLIAVFNKKPTKFRKRLAEGEGEIIKKIVEFELSIHKKDDSWSFSSGGLSRLNDDFFLLNQYLNIVQDEQFTNICKRWGPFALSIQDLAEINGIPDENARTSAQVEKVRPQFQPVWSFFMALCHALQETEDNDLTASDAYWLGLIDEVIGVDMRSLRVLVENPPPEPESEEATISETRAD